MNSPCSLVAVSFLTIVVLTTQQVSCQHDVDILGLNDTIFGHDSITSDDLPGFTRCQPMDIPFCESVPYNSTILPNFLGHKTQRDVIYEINMFHPLLRINCSNDLRLFLCTVYAPMCFDNVMGEKPISLLPCRSLCESARRGCSAHLEQVNTGWPPELNCEKFPDKRDSSGPCVSKDDEISIDDYSSRSKSGITRDLGFVCPRNFEVKSYTLHLNGKTYNNCALPCDDVLLDKSGTQVVRLTVGILAIICTLSTVFTCITFLCETKRFKYPARPIIIIAFCQMIVALCFLLGFLTSNKIACNDPTEPPKSLPNMKMVRTVTLGNKKGSCTLQFMALYFFQMSTVFWWLMMTVSWFMIARLKWAPEAVSSVARNFHLISWTVPALLTIYLSVLGNIEGDSLTGTCYVNTSNQESIKAFVVYPILICLIAGFLFLAAGFKSVHESWETLRREYGKQTDEHYKLVIRIGLYSTLFIIFSSILIYCHYHEQSNLSLWMLSWLSNICRNREYSIPCPTSDYSSYAPHYATFILKYLSTMSMGIVSALFMISAKTLTVYQEFAELCNYKL